MSEIGNAQRRALEDAELKFIEARSALDEAKGQAEGLHEAHLFDDQMFWEAIGAIDGMTGVLDDMITALGLDEAATL